MLLRDVLGACLLSFIPLALASSPSGESLPNDHILLGTKQPRSRVFGKRQPAWTSTSSATATATRVADSSCSNGPLTRSCWSNGFSIATDFDVKWPTTGVTRSYSLTITNTTCNLDGTGTKTCLLVNNQYPGPLITANWGDYLSVTVTNQMQNNGTSIHFHGVRQLNTNSMDGVPGITECPIAPGQSKTYSFQATQFGTTWYHSHYTSQYGDGIVGPVIIYGPASANYDIDLGALPITDYYYDTAYQVNIQTDNALQAGGPGPPGDNILINGTNKNSVGAGKYFQQTLTSGKKHRIRIINTGVDNAFRVSLDGHQMQVMSADFVPVQPFYTDSVLVTIGQRYDVVIDANQAVGNYWLRATVEGACASGNLGTGLAIFSYSGTVVGTPQSQSTAIDNGCNAPGQLIPWVKNDVGNVTEFQQQASSLDVNIELPGTTTNNQNIVVWGINLTAIHTQWTDPTLSYVLTGNTSYPVTANVIETPTQGIWIYWIIQEVAGGPASIPHPIHLHGHDFYIMGTGSGTFNIQTDPANLTYTNPTRRDTAILPAAGWLVLAYPTDNPGAWLMHCHIAWHISEGLGTQFLETKDKINIPQPQYSNQCNAWNSYYSHAKYKEIDSGL